MLVTAANTSGTQHLVALCAIHSCSRPRRSTLSSHREETGHSEVLSLSWQAAKWELELKSADPIGTMLTRPVLLLPSRPEGPLVLTCFVSLILK